MFDVEILTKYNIIHISVEDMKDLEEILAMPYVLDYKIKEVKQNNYKMLKKVR